MSEGIRSPQDYGLPDNHKEWRTGQYEALQWALNLEKTGVMNAPTGSGKSGIAAALAHDFKTIALVATLQLQSQYEFYDFVTISGRRHYPCPNPARLFNDATAEDCLHGSEMHKCVLSSICPYLLQKARAKAARKACLNYSYFNLVGRGKNREGILNWEKDYLVLDEAHELAHSCLDFFSVQVTEKHSKRYFLPDFPLITSGMPMQLQQGRAISWIDSARGVMLEVISDIKKSIKLKVGDMKKNVGRLRSAQGLSDRLYLVRRTLESVPEDWYISSSRQKGMLVKPLTAKHIFPSLYLFDGNAVALAMSATIGDFGAFCEELGIEEYEGRDVPNRFEAWRRPVYVYKDCPSMGAASCKNHPENFEIQADLATEAIGECPDKWSGLVHVSRRLESDLLKKRLEKRGLRGRVFSAPGSVDGVYVPTTEQLVFWEKTKEKVPNAILVTHSFGTGYDGLSERINLICKIEYPRWGSPGSYEEAYRRYSMKRYHAEAVNLTIQKAGRIRRGRDGDYDEVSKINGYVAILDGSFSKLKSKFPQSFLESVVEV